MHKQATIQSNTYRHKMNKKNYTYAQTHTHQNMYNNTFQHNDSHTCTHNYPMYKSVQKPVSWRRTHNRKSREISYNCLKSTQTKYSPFTIIPQHIIALIFECLDSTSLRLCSCVSVEFNEVSKDASLWRPFGYSLFGNREVCVYENGEVLCTREYMKTDENMETDETMKTDPYEYCNTFFKTPYSNYLINQRANEKYMQSLFENKCITKFILAVGSLTEPYAWQLEYKIDSLHCVAFAVDKDARQLPDDWSLLRDNIDSLSIYAMIDTPESVIHPDAYAEYDIMTYNGKECVCVFSQVNPYHDPRSCPHVPGLEYFKTHMASQSGFHCSHTTSIDLFSPRHRHERNSFNMYAPDENEKLSISVTLSLSYLADTFRSIFSHSSIDITEKKTQTDIHPSTHIHTHSEYTYTPSISSYSQPPPPPPCTQQKTHTHTQRNIPPPPPALPADPCVGTIPPGFLSPLNHTNRFSSMPNDIALMQAFLHSLLPLQLHLMLHTETDSCNSGDGGRVLQHKQTKTEQWHMTLSPDCVFDVPNKLWVPKTIVPLPKHYNTNNDNSKNMKAAVDFMHPGFVFDVDRKGNISFKVSVVSENMTICDDQERLRLSTEVCDPNGESLIFLPPCSSSKENPNVQCQNLESGEKRYSFETCIQPRLPSHGSVETHPIWNGMAFTPHANTVTLTTTSSPNGESKQRSVVSISLSLNPVEVVHYLGDKALLIAAAASTLFRQM